jgi:hypothetical protein
MTSIGRVIEKRSRNDNGEDDRAQQFHSSTTFPQTESGRLAKILIKMSRKIFAKQGCASKG